MAKKAPKRKLNRKSKRLIRRSIAAVMMITAIGVAAIPVPDIQADTGSGTGGSSPEKRSNVETLAQQAESSGTRRRVQYSVEESDYLNPNLRTNLLNPNLGTHTSVDRTYTIKQLSNGQWKYNWQFEFYVVNGETVTTELGTTSSVTGGIISQYNKEYEEPTVELQAVNPLEYYEVAVNDYTTFYTTGNPGCQEFRLTYDIYKNYRTTGAWADSSIPDFLSHYFNAEYEDFIKQCKLHYEDETDGNEVINTTAPNPLVKVPNSHFTTTESKYQYYCDVHFAQGAGAIANRGALTLLYALDGRSAGSSTASSYVYLVRLASGKSQGDLLTAYADKDGFVCKSQSAEIIGIANNAFKDVTKIETLILPTEIRFIGDSAFEGSFLQNIELTNVSDIGNMTFKNCNRLTNVVVGNAVNVIGAEAFSGSSLTSITLPYSVKIIGAGAFSYCTKLKNADLNSLAAGNNENVVLGKYAFFDCYGLDNVAMENSGISMIGEGAFATVRTGTSSTQGTWSDIVLPSQISAGNLGDWLFDGRTTLKKVTFPSNFGYSSEAEIPQNTFRGCVNLQEVVFPDYGNGTCGYITYKPYLFLDVVEPNFVVSGPATNLAGQIASPRTSTWGAITSVSDYIPYKYKDNRTGIEYHEVSDGYYLLTANAEGVLMSCKLNEGVTPPTGGLELVIPDYVGNYKINSIDSACFEDDAMKNAIRTIIIEDDSVSEISDETFMNLPKLQSVVIGNSVNRIGDRAFEGCEKLVDVTFNSPANGDYTGFEIGTDAFKTGSSKLTFHGDIVEGYAPYDWAMSADNYINKDLGIRVCYKSLSPTNLTVMYDNATGDRTLVDYPKYSRLDEDNQEFIEKMENTYYNKYADTTNDDYNARRDSFLTEWNTNGEAAYAGDWYGPWVNQTWIAEQTGLGNWTSGTPVAYFDNPSYTYSIIKNYENPGTNEWQSLTPLAESWVNSALKIVVPSGVDSIDVKAYMESGSNRYNLITYLQRGDGLRAEDYDMYALSQQDTKDNVDVVPGLFSGLYQDYSEDTNKEKKYRGNDRVEEIVLESVKKLPDYAFDSCENLKKVTIGPRCEDIGNTPFRGCDNLSEVVFQENDKYTSNKAIIYSVNDDGSYTIEECLPYRGLDSSIAPPVVNLNNDPDLANVTSIKEGAFEDCNYVSAIDLRDTDNLTEIPEKAFKNCKILTQVFLPESVNSIKGEAFAYDFGDDNPSRVTATIPGREVHIATDAFEHQPTVTIRSYKDSAAYEYADYHNLGWEDLTSTYQVVFLDHDGTQLGDIQYVEEGKNATPPADPTREGYTFIGWSEDYNGISKDTIIVAQYKQDGTDPDNPGGNGGSGGNGGNGGTGGDNGNGGSGGSETPTDPNTDGKLYTVMVIKGDGGGSYLSGSTVKIIADDPPSGQKFSHWSSADGVAFANNNSATTTFVMPKKNVTVTANFTGKSSSSGGSTVSGNNNGQNGSGTKVTINKPGFSNADLSSATVNGSSDNFIVRINESAASTQAIENALIAEYGSLENIQYFPMDISLWDSTGSTKITDTTGLSVDITIPLPDSLVKYSGNNKAAGVVNDRLDKLSAKFTTIDGVPCITFRATHFSPYVIYVDTTNLTADTIQDSTPKTGDGIHPKWFLAIGLASLSMILFLKKDKVQPSKKAKLA